MGGPISAYTMRKKTGPLVSSLGECLSFGFKALKGHTFIQTEH